MIKKGREVNPDPSGGMKQRQGVAMEALAGIEPAHKRFAGAVSVPSSTRPMKYNTQWEEMQELLPPSPVNHL